MPAGTPKGQTSNAAVPDAGVPDAVGRGASAYRRTGGLVSRSGGILRAGALGHRRRAGPGRRPSGENCPLEHGGRTTRRRRKALQGERVNRRGLEAPLPPRRPGGRAPRRPGGRALRHRRRPRGTGSRLSCPSPRQADRSSAQTLAEAAGPPLGWTAKFPFQEATSRPAFLRAASPLSFVPDGGDPKRLITKSFSVHPGHWRTLCGIHVPWTWAQENRHERAGPRARLALRGPFRKPSVPGAPARPSWEERRARWPRRPG
jgi:hypothetical protein